MTVSSLTRIIENPNPAALIQAAWDAAHEVPEGAVIPAGMAHIVRWHDGTYSFRSEHESIDPGRITTFIRQFRTLEPLPEPEPEWVKADFVWADSCDVRTIYERNETPQGREYWTTTGSSASYTRDQVSTLNPVPVKGEGE